MVRVLAALTTRNRFVRWTPFDEGLDVDQLDAARLAPIQHGINYEHTFTPRKMAGVSQEVDTTPKHFRIGEMQGRYKWISRQSSKQRAKEKPPTRGGFPGSY